MRLPPNPDPIYDALRDASEGYSNPYKPNTANHRLYEQAAARHALNQGRLSEFEAECDLAEREPNFIERALRWIGVA
jgi:hypothetical protein